MLKLEITITERPDGAFDVANEEWRQGDVSLNEERLSSAIIGMIDGMNSSLSEADQQRISMEIDQEVGGAIESAATIEGIDGPEA